jgi:hypothetical protein
MFIFVVYGQKGSPVKIKACSGDKVCKVFAVKLLQLCALAVKDLLFLRFAGSRNFSLLTETKKGRIHLK